MMDMLDFVSYPPLLMYHTDVQQVHWPHWCKKYSHMFTCLPHHSQDSNIKDVFEFSCVHPKPRAVMCPSLDETLQLVLERAMGHCAWKIEKVLCSREWRW